MNNKAGLTLFFPINTMSKLFCSCPNSDAAGIAYCPICRDMPGVMPLINKQALNAAIAAGCMLKIHFSASSFERKPIFCGERLIQYTITQENSPIGTNGCIRFDTEDIKINKIYLEQETGIAGGKIDYNKRGRPLLGIETAVCFNDAYQACSFYQQLQARLKKKGLIKEGRTNTGILRFSNGPEIAQIELNQLKEGDVLVLAGSIPSSMSVNIYRDIMADLKDRGVMIVVDATKDLLLNVLEYHPFLIKPNNHELGEIFDVKLTTREEVIPYGRKLQEKGARNVLVSMAGEGAVLIAEDGQVFDTPAPKGKLINGVGAGDSMVAGFVAGWIEKQDYEYAFHMGVASGSASAFSENLATKEEIINVYNQVMGK